ncbi:hypothetical protein RSOLAG1IB_11014 [Rhizoctonia solani AG-1 IB]|uniref:Uncharacterized protein n=1 Tax=Thanatephorus cucumeris (strain AG1-IB / isolate 7/3/14) TaxID=1108050 RepID=M5C2G9_THACB|nr:hypothetical protein BN14_07288 [Rhizoctonia solani AG-1 IB]CEL64030.1 hypothetical protein RSOLAG1IB_11014 [Rhizoctonia solani AG-1 IB]
MPIGDPADQKAARENRTRKSGKLLKAALKLTEPLLKHASTAWAKEKATKQAREERLAELRAKPRDLDCLRSPDGVTWQGVGRRKRRCRKFNAFGRAFTARQGVAAAAPVPQPSEENIYVIHAARLPKWPGTSEVEHRVMDTQLAYVMALGRWEYRNWSPAISLRQGATMVLEAEESLPEVPEGLIDVLIPHGFDQFSLAQLKFSYFRDFVLGWYAVAPDHGLEV